MTPIKGIIQQGQVVLTRPVDLPDGTEVNVVPVNAGMPGEEDKPLTPEEIADWLKWYDSLQPLIFTDEERAAWEADRQARKKWEKAHFDEHAEQLRRMWQ
jgi:hypothetical protein